MLARDLQKALVNYTVKNSGHEARRGYIGLSEMGLCERVIYEHYRHGLRDDGGVQQRLVNKISFELEAALIARLKAIGVYQPGKTISLSEGLVQGHTDGQIGDDLLEIKTVALEEHFPVDGHLPRKIFYQVQGYMHYTGLKNALVVYLARANGALLVVSVRYQEAIGREIAGRVERLQRAVREVKVPMCSCGRCGVVKNSRLVVSGR